MQINIIQELLIRNLKDTLVRETHKRKWKTKTVEAIQSNLHLLTHTLQS